MPGEGNCTTSPWLMSTSVIICSLLLQNFKDEITLNTHDIERMQQVIKTIPTTEHITLSTAKMELELTEMEATIHTLSARVQVGAI